MDSLVKVICKDKLSSVLFAIIYLIIIFLVIGVIPASDNGDPSYLFYHKYLFYLWTGMSIWAHIKCAITNPGKIVHEFNPHMIEFYLLVREESILRGITLSEKIGQKAFQNFPNDVNSDDEYTDYDDKEYPAVTSIQDNIVETLKSRNKINFKRCDRCFVVRFPGVKHCSKCEGCIMSMDHHCPWVFNCIGQFNQKFFIQFLIYSFFGISEAGIISIYYIFHKDKQ
jgi:hypothetical protein